MGDHGVEGGGVTVIMTYHSSYIIIIYIIHLHAIERPFFFPLGEKSLKEW